MITKNPRLTPSFVLATTAAWLVSHSAIWSLAAYLQNKRYGVKYSAMLLHWDAEHYTSIILRGYSGTLWAFYPLYPLLTKGFAALSGLESRPEVAGTIFSTLCFAAFCAIIAHLTNHADTKLRWLIPQTRWGWLFFLASPASWIFHSHHTEALFLLLSFAAFFAARKGSWRTAALLAGLCALTRNQGVFVAIAVALESALRCREATFRTRTLIFCGSGALSFLLFACYPVYQYVEAKDALAFVNAQKSWHLVTSFHQVIGTLWFANPWQGINWRDVLHLILFFLHLGIACIWLLKKEIPLAVYVVPYVCITLFQGELVNLFRFSAPLFPSLFFLGDITARLPKALRWMLFIGLIYINFLITKNYALGEWAY